MFFHFAVESLEEEGMGNKAILCTLVQGARYALLLLSSLEGSS